MIGLCNVAGLEGAEHNVKCNIIAPGAVTRMAEGLDTSIYPPMGPELVAPLVAWMCHEQCSVSGEMLSAMAGRLSRMYLAETPGRSEERRVGKECVRTCRSRGSTEN